MIRGCARLRHGHAPAHPIRPDPPTVRPTSTSCDDCEHAVVARTTRPGSAAARVGYRDRSSRHVCALAVSIAWLPTGLLSATACVDPQSAQPRPDGAAPASKKQRSMSTKTIEHNTECLAGLVAVPAGTVNDRQEMVQIAPRQAAQLPTSCAKLCSRRAIFRPAHVPT